MIRVIAYPRIHVTLLALHEGGYRVNGGVGFTINSPVFETTATRSKALTIANPPPSLIDSHTCKYIENRIKSAAQRLQLRTDVQLTVRSGVGSHFGLGSTTALTLAAMEAWLQYLKYNLPQDELIGLSGRGGTSGVGVFSYFDGGLSLDLGRAARRSEQFVSSEDATDRTLPLRVARTNLLLGPIGLLFPMHISAKTIAEEREFFRLLCPLPRQATLETTYHAVMGVYAAAAEGDYHRFCDAINCIQACDWKRGEIGLYGSEVSGCIDMLKRLGADAAGMSSLGPLVYFFSDKFEQITAKLAAHLPQWQLITSEPRNAGREVFLE